MKLGVSDTVALVEVWAGLKNYIPQKDQRQSAEQYISSLEDHGLADFSIDGVCEVFDAVLRTYCVEQGYHDDNDNDNDEWDEY
jgi:hypothetical protein